MLNETAERFIPALKATNPGTSQARALRYLSRLDGYVR